MTLDEAYEYVEHANEAEGEQRAEYGSGAVSLGYDGNEAMMHYDGYSTANDPEYKEAQRIIAAASDRATWQIVGKRIDAAIADNNDDIPF